MAEETRERSTTSAVLWPEAVIGDLNNDSCWLYLMKGFGSDRDIFRACCKYQLG